MPVRTVLQTWYRNNLILKSSIFWDIMPCSPVKVNHVAEEHVTFIFNPEDGGDMFLRNVCLPPTFTLVSFLAYSSTLEMEMACSSKASVDFQWTLHNLHCENLKSYIIYFHFPPTHVKWTILDFKFNK
jgi:hypothetical protein